MLILLTGILLFTEDASANNTIHSNMKMKPYFSSAQNFERYLILSVPMEKTSIVPNASIDSTIIFFSRIYDSIKMMYTVDYAFVDSTGKYKYRYKYLDFGIYPTYFLIINSRYGFVENISIDTRDFDVELNPPSITHNYIPFDSINQRCRTKCK